MQNAEMRLPQLSPRLAMTAALVPPGLGVADIGSDHAYLPVHLVREGICLRAIAADIGEGPLENARQTIAHAGLQSKIELRLSDGFSQFEHGDAGCWVMAGMGGTLMARLLEAAPWLQRPGTVLAAQPMRRPEELRAWLISHGFMIELESVCQDAGRTYMALRAVYNGHRRAYPPGYTYYGELANNPDPCARALLLHTLKVLEARRKNPVPKEALDDFRSRCL